VVLLALGGGGQPGAVSSCVGGDCRCTDSVGVFICRMWLVVGRRRVKKVDFASLCVRWCMISCFELRCVVTSTPFCADFQRRCHSLCQFMSPLPFLNCTTSTELFRSSTQTTSIQYSVTGVGAHNTVPVCSPFPDRSISRHFEEIAGVELQEEVFRKKAGMFDGILCARTRSSLFFCRP
jgi:hypothetical protein